MWLEVRVLFLGCSYVRCGFGILLSWGRVGFRFWGILGVRVGLGVFGLF